MDSTHFYILIVGLLFGFIFGHISGWHKAINVNNEKIKSKFGIK